MHQHTRRILTTIAATTLLALGVSSASANHFSMTEKQFKAVWNPLTFKASSFEIRCPVTLEGSFHERTLVKGEKNLIGFVTRAAVRNEACTGGNFTVLTETLPWHIRYDSFASTLPNITEIRILISGVSLQLGANTIFGQIQCLAHSEDNNPLEAQITRNTRTGALTGLIAEPNTPIPIVSGSGFCPSTETFENTATITTPGGGTITVTLI